MKARTVYLRLISAISLALVAPCLWAQDGARGALSQTDFTSRFEHPLAIADLDGDNQPDGAVLVKSGWPGSTGLFKIQLHLTNHTNSEIAFQSTEAMIAVTAWDIDNDGDTDIVVEEALTHKPLHVWINNGRGDFHEGRVQDFPSLASGAQDQLRSRNTAYCPAVCLPLQRGFEVPIMAPSVLDRPASTSNWKSASVGSPVHSHVRALNSSRAPPLS